MEINGKRISKTRLASLIEIHFRLKGKRLTNLKKSTIEKLIDIIKKYNINNLGEILKNLEEEEEEEKEEEEKRQKERKEEQKKRDEEYEKKELLLKKRIAYYEKQPDNIKMLFIKKYIKTIFLDKIPDNIKHNEELKLRTDIEEKLAIQEGLKVERTDINTLIINYIHVHMDYKAVESYSETEIIEMETLYMHEKFKLIVYEMYKNPKKFNVLEIKENGDMCIHKVNTKIN
jgi:hypothetical protein